MTFGISRGVAVDTAGNVQTGVWVEVRRVAPGFPLQPQLYEDAEGVGGLANPFFSESGEFEFYCVGGTYRVRAYKAGYDKTWDDVPVGTAQAADVDAYATAGFTWAPESATGTPPTAGCIRANNADWMSATHLYVDDDTLGGSTVSAWLLALANGDDLYLSTGVGIELGWTVSAVSDEAGYVDITVTGYNGPAGPLSLGDSGFVTLGKGRAGTNGTDGKFSGTEVIKTAAYTALATDVGKTIVLNKATSDTLSFDPVATLGSTWMIIVKNIGVGTWVLDPNSAETIDGVATISLLTGQSLVVASNGTSLRTMFLSSTGIGGSTGATDNRLLRADGTGGVTAQSSAVTVDDSGNMSGLGTITSGQIAASSTGAPVTGNIATANNFSDGFVMRKRGATGDATAAVASSSELGFHSFWGWDGSTYGRAAFVLVSTVEAFSGTARGANYRIFTTTPTTTTEVERMRIGQGVYHPSATGGDKLNNTINFGAVYDDNTLLTCMAMAKEFIEDGKVDLDKWDDLVPDQIEHEQRWQRPVTVEVPVKRVVTERGEDGDLVRKTVVGLEQRQLVTLDPVWDEEGNGVDAIETPLTEEVITPERIIKRQHRTARIFSAMLATGFDPRDPEQYFAKMRSDEALPGMPTQADWTHNDLSIGELTSQKWLAMEMLAIVCNVMWAKLKDHEQRLTSAGL